MGIESSVMKKAATNSAIFSIVPSLPILIVLMVLSVPLGRYFPWLRLSVVGSAAYESMASNIVAQTMGLESISDPGFNLDIFTAAMWVMTLGVIWGISFNIIFMKSLDKFSKKAKSKGSGFVAIFSSALFMGVLGIMATPYAVNTANMPGIFAFVGAAIAAVLCDRIAAKTKYKVIGEFSLPISLLVGMATAIIYSQIAV